MAMFAKNVSFAAVHLMWLKPSVTARLLEKTVQLLDQGRIQPPQPLVVFGLRDVEAAFRGSPERQKHWPHSHCPEA